MAIEMSEKEIINLREEKIELHSPISMNELLNMKSEQLNASIEEQKKLIRHQEMLLRTGDGLQFMKKFVNVK